MARRDLGTYHLRVEFVDGRGFIETWNTGARFELGDAEVSPLGAHIMLPPWECEEDLFGTMVFMHTDGNSACDCNRLLMLARAHHEPLELDEVECGDEIKLKRLTAIRPNGDEVVLYGSLMLPGEFEARMAKFRDVRGDVS